MLKPFFSKAGHIVYCGDSRKILPKLTQQADMLMTDLPYGCNYENRKREKIYGDDESFDLSEYLSPALRALKIGSKCFCFCDLDSKPLIQAHPVSEVCRMIWVKNIKMPRRATVLPNTETLFFFLNGKNLRDKSDTHIGEAILHPTLPSKGRFHPTQKPVALLRQYIKAGSNQGNTVLDICAGSGSVAIAAFLEGRKSISIEIEQKHCENIAKRLDYAIMTGKVPESRLDIENTGCSCQWCLDLRKEVGGCP